MKSVLLHVQDDEGLEARLQAAMAIVRASGGHLSCRLDGDRVILTGSCVTTIEGTFLLP